MINKKITMGIMGSSQYKHLIPVFEEDGYIVKDLQKIFESELSISEKEELFRKEIKDCDLLYNLFSHNFFWAKASYAKSIGKKVVTHWIGTDALDALEGRLGYLGHSYIDYNFSCFEAIQTELQEIGIETTVLPIIPFNMELKLCEMPSKHAVLIYLPENRLEHYGYEESCYVISKFPNIDFHIVANSKKELFEDYPNVKVYGYLSHKEMEELYKEVSILIRYIKHDGLSMAVIEALAKGKNVIWNYEYFGVNKVDSKEDICKQLSDIIKDAPKQRIEVSEIIIDKLSKKNFIEEFNRVMETI